MSAFTLSAWLFALQAPWAEANDLAVALGPSIVIDRAPDSTTAAVEQSPKLNAELPTQSEDLLLGNAKGIRQWFSSRGIEVGVRLKTDLVQNFDGGIERKPAILSNLDMTFEVDLEKVAGFDGFRFFFYSLYNDGDRPSKFHGYGLLKSKNRGQFLRPRFGICGLFDY